MGGSFRRTQPQTVLHNAKPLLSQMDTAASHTGFKPRTPQHPTQDSNPGHRSISHRIQTQDTAASHTGFKPSKDEMTSSKDEMTSSKDEMPSSKDEMTSSKDDMTSSKDEMT